MVSNYIVVNVVFPTEHSKPGGAGGANFTQDEAGKINFIKNLPLSTCILNIQCQAWPVLLSG